MAATVNNHAIVVKTTPRGVVNVLIVGKSNLLDRKTRVSLQTVESVGDLLGKHVQVTGHFRDKLFIATRLCEQPAAERP